MALVPIQFEKAEFKNLFQKRFVWS